MQDETSSSLRDDGEAKLSRTEPVRFIAMLVLTSSMATASVKVLRGNLKRKNAKHYFAMT